MKWVTAVFRVPWWGLKWCFRTKRRALISTVVFFCLFSSGSYGAYQYSMSPTFCHSCHIMDPYYESWEHSSHREVTCVQCHFEPGLGNELHGKWVAVKQLASAVTGAYSSMPYAEVSDTSCMRSGCHTTAELSKPVRFTGKSIGFKHETHTGEMLRGIKLACTSCHFQKLVDTHMEVDKSTCFLCHFKGSPDVVATLNGHDIKKGAASIGDCETCHGPPDTAKKIGRFDVDHEVYRKRGMACVQCHVEFRPTASPVGEERCYSCHNEPGKISKIGDIGLMHVAHVTGKKLHCYQCHNLIPHQFGARRAGTKPEDALHDRGDCYTCHSDRHGPQAQLYAGLGAKGVAASPDAMHVVGLDCIGCHRVPNGHGKSVLPPAQSCAKCHEDRYSKFVPEFGRSSTAMQTHLEKRFAAVQTKIDALKEAKKMLPRDVYRRHETIAHNLTFLKKAGPVHNPIYAVQILRAANESLYELEEAVGIEFDGDLPVGFEAEDCRVCHAALPVPGVLALATGREFPHPIHVEKTGMGCADCHQGARHPAAAPTNENSCNACHKGDKALPPLELKKK